MAVRHKLAQRMFGCEVENLEELDFDRPEDESYFLEIVEAPKGKRRKGLLIRFDRVNEQNQIVSFHVDTEEAPRLARNAFAGAVAMVGLALALALVALWLYTFRMSGWVLFAGGALVTGAGAWLIYAPTRRYMQAFLPSCLAF